MAKGRITVAMLFLLSALSASADDNVTVVTASGETPYAMESISRIDFSETGITVVAQDKEGVTYAFDEDCVYNHADWHRADDGSTEVETYADRG